MKRFVGLVALLLFLWIPISTAQSDTLLAFLNGSGQLVVSSGNGATRWIVTNPGQAIDQTLGFAWTTEGHLVFALTGAGVFVGDPDTQAIAPVDDTDFATWSHLRGLTNRPNIAQPQGVSADGDYVFIWSQGRYGIVSLVDNTSTVLPMTGNQDARGSGLWADNVPLVTYWGVDGSNTALAVYHPPTENLIGLNSGSTLPIPPIAWQPDTTRLIYRPATGDIQIADVGCVMDECGDNPLENGISVAPSSANHPQVTADQLYYVDGNQVYGVDLTCVDTNTCLESRFVVGQNIAPLSMIHASGDRLVYTAYTSDPNNPSDRTIHMADLTCAPDCPPRAILNSAVAGLLSPSADFVMVDIAGQGLNILHINNGTLVYLTDTMGGQLGAGLNVARWR